MQNRALHGALRQFFLEAAALLTDDLKGGAELQFELVDRGRGAALYHYRARTEDFIAERRERIMELESAPAAAEVLAPAVPAYARVRGLDSAKPAEALVDLLRRLYDDASSFAFPERRFESLCAEIEQGAERSTLTATILTPIIGLGAESDRIALDDELALVTGGPEFELPEVLRGEEPGTSVLAVYSIEQGLDAPLPLDDARSRLRRLVTGLRLTGAGAAATGPLAWARAGEGAWEPLPLEAGRRTLASDRWWLAAEDEADLRELLSVLGRSRHSPAIAWAMRRFEMGCERPLRTEALSDFALALRALVGGAARDDSRIAMRTAALCSPEVGREAAAARVRRALDLEGLVIGGVHSSGGDASWRDLVDLLEHCVRALLRDVLCGYLEDDLAKAADDLLVAGGAPGEVKARDLRAAEVAPDPQTLGADADDGEPRIRIASLETAEFEALGFGSPHEASADADPEQGIPEAGWDDGDPMSAVTPSDDWQFEDPDDDAASYAGPI